MQALNLPKQPIKLKQEAHQLLIFDDFRKKYLVCTPEEWVRQNFLHYLVKEKNYPKGLISIEKGLKLGELQKRADALISSTQGEYQVLIEFKSPKVGVNQDVFEQVARYNSVFKVPYLIVSNGINHYCAKVNFEENSFEFLKDIPEFSCI